MDRRAAQGAGRQPGGRLTKSVHKDLELKPPPAALRALSEWMEANGGILRSALVSILETHQTQVHRVFNGQGCLSLTQRRALEKFTEGAITEAMLAGREAPPSRIAPPRQEPAPPTLSPEDAEKYLEGAAAKALPWGIGALLKQAKSTKSDPERRRTIALLFDRLDGKARQREEKQRDIEHATDEELLRKLILIEAQLGGRSLAWVEAETAGGEYQGEGLA